ncbi:ATP-binding protein [Streptomyces sp. NPDC052051]|uniref:ATP-binding protein n=1 Tax=Streptomyces sp. NPDC052051 TaxID=3154649 RepID=UPI00343A7A38
MKQSAAKTLGVAALGAAFAAAGAGVASAAPAAPPAAGPVNATQALPTGKLTQSLPGASEALGQGQRALGMALTATQPATQRVLADGPAAPVTGLLGGLPVKGLPTHGLPVNGVPLG